MISSNNFNWDDACEYVREQTAGECALGTMVRFLRPLPSPASFVGGSPREAAKPLAPTNGDGRKATRLGIAGRFPAGSSANAIKYSVVRF